MRVPVCVSGDVATPATKAAPFLGLYPLGVMQGAREGMGISR